MQKAIDIFKTLCQDCLLVTPAEELQANDGRCQACRYDRDRMYAETDVPEEE